MSNKVFFCFLIFLFSSCSVKDYEVRCPFNRAVYHTKSGFAIDSTLLVSYEDAIVYANAICRGTKKELVGIRPVYYDGVPTSYIIDFSDGWTMISADKRGPIVLAISERDGKYDDEMPEGAEIWLESLNKEIAYRWSSNLPVNKDFEPEAASIDYWDSLLGKVTPEMGGDRVIDPDAPIGHFVIISEESHPVVYDSIPHLTTTLWHQNNPYNAACPFKRGGSSTRVPAGCGAVATAQMLYYLHDYLGTPALAPAYASCTGDIDNYSFDIPSPSSSTIWSEMNNGSSASSNKAYVLVADMANRLNTIFDDDEGVTYINDFPTVLASYGIHSTYTPNRVPDTLRVNLLKGFPVIMRGARNVSSGEAGHFFLVDGYIRLRLETTTVYAIEWDPPRPINLDGDFILVTYSSPYIALVKMNWGWSNNSHANDSYALTGSWLADEGIVYDHGYRMVSGFYVDND